MRTTSVLAALIAGALFAAASLAEGQDVTVTVPVDISAMPYIKTFSVQCQLIQKPDQTELSNGAAHNRVDKPLVNGEFHGTVSMLLVAVWSQGYPPPWGYRCNLLLFPKDNTSGFEPIAASAATASDPPEHVAAPGTSVVAMVQRGFGPMTPVHTPGPALQPLAPKY